MNWKHFAGWTILFVIALAILAAWAYFSLNSFLFFLVCAIVIGLLVLASHLIES